MRRIANGYLTRLAAGLGLPLALLSLASCDDAPQDGKRTHVVCHSGGVRVLDDFGSAAHLGEGGIYYESDTTHARTRVTGDCAAFRDAIPDGWKALLPGMTKDIQQ
jgi:hypothetical protein